MQQLEWQDHGGAGPYLVLLHGFLMSQAQWQPNLPALKRVCRPVTVDLWGHGDSPAPTAAEPYHPDALVDSLDAIRAELGAETWALCGYSLGGAITLRYALRHPTRVLAHAFTNSTSALAEPALTEQWAEQGNANRATAIAAGLPGIRNIAVHPRFAKKVPSALLEPNLEAAERLSPTGVANVMAYTTPNASVRTELKSNCRPARLICGVRERRFAPYRAFAEATMPKLEIAELDTGHAVNLEDAAGFDTTLTDFLQCHAS